MSESTSSERHNSEEQLLVEELTHRMNNEFAAAIAVVSRAGARSPNGEVRSALAVVEERLHSYVQVNRCLQIPSQDTVIDASAHLRRLCQSISRSRLDCRGIELQFAGRPLQMNSERCWRLGMIISELVTNAARHAFADAGTQARSVCFDPFAIDGPDLAPLNRAKAIAPVIETVRCDDRILRRRKFE